MALPRSFVEEGLRLADDFLLFGVPLRELTQEELLAATAQAWHMHRKDRLELLSLRRGQARDFLRDTVPRFGDLPPPPTNPANRVSDPSLFSRIFLSVAVSVWVTAAFFVIYRLF